MTFSLGLAVGHLLAAFFVACLGLGPWGLVSVAMVNVAYAVGLGVAGGKR